MPDSRSVSGLKKCGPTQNLSDMSVGPTNFAKSANVGNEDGKILNCVVTAGEGHGLKNMIQGIVNRYATFGESPTKVLYVDRDCCGNSNLRKMLSAWPDLQIRLDIWHFMRRFSSCCNTDSHQLYGTFMSRLSKTIFEWSNQDIQNLREAKRSELQSKQVPIREDVDILRQLSKRELALHCRRQTRGAEETTRLISELIGAFTGDDGLDTMGFPLLNKEKIHKEWDSQKKHVVCIQDPHGISLYTQTGTVKKGTVTLPALRCARGSTSLESFHLHLARFIPGTIASDHLFQAYLLDGLVRWNEDRTRQMSKEMTQGKVPGPSSYSGILRHAVNDLGQRVLEKKLVQEYQPPRKYTGELIGIEYLYNQTGKPFQELELDEETTYEGESDSSEEDESRQSDDEGFSEDIEDPTIPPVEIHNSPVLRRKKSTITSSQPITLISTLATPNQTPVTTSQTISQDAEGPSHEIAGPSHQELSPAGEDSDDTYGPDNIPGYDHVEDLVEYLFTLRDQTMALSDNQATHIIRLWNQLSEYDKRGSRLSPRYRPAINSGRFRSTKSKTTVTPGLDCTKRCFVGFGSGPAQHPDANRYMEALTIKLLAAFPSPVKQKSKTIQRYSVVLQKYTNIQQKVVQNSRVMEDTNIMLLEMNQKTIGTFDQKRTKAQEIKISEQGISLPVPQMSAKMPLPPLRDRFSAWQQAPIPPDQEHTFDMPPITAGSGRTRRISRTASSSTARGSNLAKTTLWYQKKQEQKKRNGEYVRINVKRRETHTYTCRKCGKDRSNQTHKQESGFWWCAETATESESDWREKCREHLRKKKQEKEAKKRMESEDS